MALVVGTDEAGYGPNLGPLVVGATAWQLPSDLPAENLYQVLSQAITAAPAGKGDPRLAIADSKQLYKPGGSLAPLERGVLAALGLLGRQPGAWSQLWPLIDSETNGDLHSLPWHDGYDEPLPVAAETTDLPRVIALVESNLAKQGIRLAKLQARVLFPREFNDEVERRGNKAEVLSLVTLALARQITLDLPQDDVLVICDKHGGRGRYAALLQHVFDDALVRIRVESRELSVYELISAGRRIEFRFLPKGERHLPTALASMTAKYLRELAMRPFNAFWRRHVPGLRATAGYPEDARRFRRDIHEAQLHLRIDDGVLWRTR